MAVAVGTAAKGRSVSEQIRRVLKRPQLWFGLAVMIPWFVFYVVVAYRPIFMGLWMSVLKYKLLNPSASEFIGIRNFQNVLSYERFWIALKNSATYAVFQYGLTMPLALLISWCIVTVKRGRRFYQFIIFVPVVASLVAISMLFTMLMDPQFGTFNRILRSLGLPTSMWVNGSRSALPSCVAVDVWKGLGFSVLLLSTAMLGVPESLYDAARVDGVNAWQEFRHVTMPLISNVVAMISVLVVNGALQVYITPNILGPGPGTSTLVMNQLIITEAFTNWRFGFGMATSLIVFVLILGLTIFQMRVLQRRWEY
jgi:ABC-type sugar transport system permease subunit